MLLNVKRNKIAQIEVHLSVNRFTLLTTVAEHQVLEAILETEIWKLLDLN